MKIITIPIHTGIEFRTLQESECFEYDDKYFMKIESIADGYQEYNAVVLANGELTNFSSTDRVGKLNATLNVEREFI